MPATRYAVAEKVELEIVVERRVTRISEAGGQQGVAVRGRIEDGLRCDIGARAGPVLDDDLLAKLL